MRQTIHTTQPQRVSNKSVDLGTECLCYCTRGKKKTKNTARVGRFWKQVQREQVTLMETAAAEILSSIEFVLAIVESQMQSKLAI